MRNIATLQAQVTAGVQRGVAAARRRSPPLRDSRRLPSRHSDGQHAPRRSPAGRGLGCRLLRHVTGQQYTQAAQGFASQMGELVNSGPELQAALKKAGMKGVSMADAFQIAQNALLDMSHAFD